MQLQHYIVKKQKILSNQYKKVKLLGYVTVRMNSGEVIESFIPSNTQLSKEGNEVKSEGFPNEEATTGENGTVVLFEVNDKGKLVNKEFYFLWS